MAPQYVPGADYRARMEATLAAFAAAWARCDIDALMELVGDSPLYRTSGGLSFEGRDSVRLGFEQMCKPSPPSPAQPPPQFFDNKCICYWNLSLSPGAPPISGVDIITFDTQARIISKDAYRKLR